MTRIRHAIAAALVASAMIVATPWVASAFTLNPWEIPVVAYSGRLTDDSGVPVAFGNYQLKLRLFDHRTAGTELFIKSYVDVLVEDGYFSVMLTTDDNLVNIVNAVVAAPVRYLEIEVEGETLSPRQVIYGAPWGTVPYPTSP